jgi:hypothetical protein
MPRGLKIGIGIGVVVIASIAFIVWWVISLTNVLVEPVARQLAALKAGNMEAADAETSEAFRQVTSMEAFATFVDQFPALKDAADYSFPRRQISNNEGTIDGTITSSTGAVTPVEYRLIYERETWKILGINAGG